MSLRLPARMLSIPRATPQCRLDVALFAGLFRRAASIDGTSKRKVNGTYAETRLGKPVTSHWLNERFRQTLLLVNEFKVNGIGAMLSSDDLQFVRVCLDVALAQAERERHVGDIYDMNSVVWACWLVQHVFASRSGKWEVESPRQQTRWSFADLYRFLEVMHARGDTLMIRDPTTRELLHRYKLSFKSMVVPPKSTELFKWRKGARRLSSWLEAGGLAPLHPGIIAQQAPTIVPPPPLAVQREARRAALWSRVAQRASQRPLESVHGEEEDAQETRAVVDGVIGRGGLSIEQIEAELLSVTAARQDERQAGGAAAAAGPSEPTANDDDDAELEAELERELMAQQGDDEEDGGVPVTAERLGPAVPEDDVAEAGHPGQQLFHINELLEVIRDL